MMISNYNVKAKLAGNPRTQSYGSTSSKKRIRQPGCHEALFRFMAFLFIGIREYVYDQRQHKKLIFAAAALFVSLCLVFGAVFAWFTTSDSVGTDGLDFGVTGDDSNGVTITSINGAKPDEKIILYPEGTLTVGLKITDDIKNFGVKLAADARDDNFNAFFAAREDLLFGVYEKGEIISDASGNMAEYWRNFDAAAPLSSLSETERLSAQVGFYTNSPFKILCMTRCNSLPS